MVLADLLSQLSILRLDQSNPINLLVFHTWDVPLQLPSIVPLGTVLKALINVPVSANALSTIVR